MIAVLGGAGTIGRYVTRFLEEWGALVARRDFRLSDEEFLDARDPESLRDSLAGADVCVNCLDYRLNLDVMRGALGAGRTTSTSAVCSTSRGSSSTCTTSSRQPA